MKKADIFDFSDYRRYLNTYIEIQPNRGRGLKNQMAIQLNSTTSHISQVLSGKTHFTFEQAEEVNDFLAHNDEEAVFFNLLVQIARAGSNKLKTRLQKEKIEILNRRSFLKVRLGVQSSVSEKDQIQFYSSWIYGAIHIITTIPSYQTKESISQYLGLPSKQVSEILNFLEHAGLVRKNEKGKYETSQTRIHLGSDSFLISKYHSNWRLKAMQALEKFEMNNQLHYSSVISIAESDIEVLKNHLIKSIAEFKKIVKDSPAEGLHCFNLDFFKI